MAVDWGCNAHVGGISSNTMSDHTPLFTFINHRAVFRQMDTLPQIENTKLDGGMARVS